MVSRSAGGAPPPAGRRPQAGLDRAEPIGRTPGRFRNRPLTAIAAASGLPATVDTEEPEREMCPEAIAACSHPVVSLPGLADRDHPAAISLGEDPATGWRTTARRERAKAPTRFRWSTPRSRRRRDRCERIPFARHRPGRCRQRRSGRSLFDAGLVDPRPPSSPFGRADRRTRAEVPAPPRRTRTACRQHISPKGIIRVVDPVLTSDRPRVESLRRRRTATGPP